MSDKVREMAKDIVYYILNRNNLGSMNINDIPPKYQKQAMELADMLLNKYGTENATK